MNITLKYKKEWEASDLDAANIALTNISAALHYPDWATGTKFYFSNLAYLNEWRMALVRGDISGLTAIYPNGVIQEFDVNGKANCWPDEIVVVLNQLKELGNVDNVNQETAN